MKTFIVIVTVLLCVFLILIYTKKISWQDIRKSGESVKQSIQKVVESINTPDKIKETTQQKLKEFDQKLDERHKNLHKGVEEGE